MTIRKIVDEVGEGAHRALEKTESTAALAKGGVLDAIGHVAEIYRALRAFGLGDMLKTVGLQRRRSPALSVGTFGAGLAAGTLLGVLIAPMSGRDARSAIMKRATALLHERDANPSDAAKVMKRADVVTDAKDWTPEQGHGRAHS